MPHVTTDFADVNRGCPRRRSARLDDPPQPEVSGTQLQDPIWMNSMVARVEGDPLGIGHQIQVGLRSIVVVQ